MKKREKLLVVVMLVIAVLLCWLLSGKQNVQFNVQSGCGLDSSKACDSLRAMKQQNVNTVAEPVIFEEPTLSRQATSLDAKEDKPSAVLEAPEAVGAEKTPAQVQARRSTAPTSATVPITE